MNKKTLKLFAKTVLSIGVNLQKGQGLEIACPIEKKEFAEALTEQAFNMGASKVNVRWENENIQKLNYLHGDIKELTSIPKWFVESKLSLVKKGYCYVAISAENPTAFSSVPNDRLNKISLARAKALKIYSDKIMNNEIRWCVVSVPTKAWANVVFPNQKNAEKLLENAIMQTMRLDAFDPIKEWDNHVKKLDERAKILNNYNFEFLKFKSKNGTNLKVGLSDNHVWLSAKEKAKDGVSFIANMPTEEIFTAPHNKKTDGVLYSAMPLVYNGNVIDNFKITFKDGKIIDFTAEKGYSTLKGLIETDEGTSRLGEVALIGKNSPIAKSGILFYNTLFDENASCHLAIGKAYPTTVKQGENLNEHELDSLGVNDSSEHVDFMIGTKDLEVIGITKNNQEVEIFKDGDWVF